MKLIQILLTLKLVTLSYANLFEDCDIITQNDNNNSYSTKTPLINSHFLKHNSLEKEFSLTIKKALHDVQNGTYLPQNTWLDLIVNGFKKIDLNKIFNEKKLTLKHTFPILNVLKCKTSFLKKFLYMKSFELYNKHYIDRSILQDISQSLKVITDEDAEILYKVCLKMHEKDESFFNIFFKLEEINIENFKIKFFNTAGLHNLKKLVLNNNSIKKIDLTFLPLLEELQINNNPISKIDVRFNKYLKNIYYTSVHHPLYVLTKLCCADKFLYSSLGLKNNIIIQII